MTPVVALAKAAILEFEEGQRERRKRNKKSFTLEEVDWKIPSETQVIDSQRRFYGEGPG